MSGARRPIAVAFVHGVEIDDPAFADNATGLLRAAFARHAKIDPDQGLTVESVYWAPVIKQYLDLLIERVFTAEARELFDWLTDLVTRVNAGSKTALAPLVLSGAVRRVPGLYKMSYPALRWMVTQFGGQAIGYQVRPGERRIYDEIHRVFAQTLRRLAERAGGDAPLCIISHSLGTVFSSNYVWDLQATKSLIAEMVRGEMGDTPLARGDTLSHFYTLGSPLALWSVPYEGFGRPIQVPSPQLKVHHPGLVSEAEWINYHDPDDMVAYPLRGLNADYAVQVREDRAVSVGPFPIWKTPLVHPWYWNDESVMDAIGAALARARGRIQES